MKSKVTKPKVPKTPKQPKLKGVKVRVEDVKDELSEPPYPPTPGFFWSKMFGKWVQREKNKDKRWKPVTIAIKSPEEILLEQMYDVVDYYEEHYGPLEEMTDEEWEVYEKVVFPDVGEEERVKDEEPPKLETVIEEEEEEEELDISFLDFHEFIFN